MVTGWIPGRPTWNAGIRSLLHFGGTITLNGVVSHLTNNFDKFIIGRVWGASALGHYGVASQLINTPATNLNTALGGVTFSGLARLQDDAARFRSYFLKGYALSVSLTIPVTIFSAVFAHDIVGVVLGPKWAETAIILQMLAPAGLFFGIANPLVWVLFASHRHVRSLKLALVIAALIFTGCLLGLPYGPKGVALGFSAAMVLWCIPHVLWCLHGTPITPGDLFKANSWPFVSAIAAVTLAYVICFYCDPLPGPFVRLGLASAVMMAAYPSLMVLVMGKDFYLDLVRAIRNTTSRPIQMKEMQGVACLPLSTQ
jgi:PST family polysaccharide transporter